VSTLTAPPVPTAASSPPDTPTGRSTRTTAVLVGLLFLTATVTFATAEALINRVVDGRDYLADASAHTDALGAAALLAFVQGIAIVAIAVLLYPVLRRHSERLALAYVGFRVAELAATLFYLAIPLVVIQLADGLRDGTVDGSASQDLAGLFPAQHGVAILMIYLVTSFGGLTLSTALYRSRLVPRSIALLGVIGYPVLFVGTGLAVFGQADVTAGAGMLALVPGGLFELILPIWLLTKGFTSHDRD
jgi:hypothetical protein